MTGLDEIHWENAKKEERERKERRKGEGERGREEGKENNE